jgi:hypothetical protein
LYEQVQNLALVDDVSTGMALAPLRWKRARLAAMIDQAA